MKKMRFFDNFCHEGKSFVNERRTPLQTIRAVVMSQSGGHILINSCKINRRIAVYFKNLVNLSRLERKCRQCAVSTNQFSSAKLVTIVQSHRKGYNCKAINGMVTHFKKSYCYLPKSNQILVLSGISI